MVYAAIGGMQLKRWTGYFKIIVPTMRVLLAAKRHDDCVYANTFKDGDVYFAVSVWKNRNALKNFAESGLHGELVSNAMSAMHFFHNYTHESEELLTREEMVSAWREAMAERGGKGSVGILSE